VRFLEGILNDIVDYAVFVLDPGGHVRTWNAGAERIKGYRRDEIVGEHFSRFYPPEVVATGWPDQELRRVVTQGRLEDEGWRIRKDGSSFWANVVITALRGGGGEVRGFLKITRDLTERRRTEALKEAGRRTSEFLAMLSHELRNPLAPIRNAVALLRAPDLPDRTLAWARDVIERQTDHLGRLVDDLLDVSRITLGKIHLERQVVDVALILQRALEAARPALDARRHRLEVVLPGEPTLVSGDLTRLTQVVLNLLTNAAKYTPDGGHVRLEAVPDGDRVVIRVRDNGIGMAPDLLRRAFDLFVQGDRGIDRSEGGLGIGLTLSRRLVDLHGGTIEGYSEGPGSGSEFVVRLPRLADADHPRGEATADVGFLAAESPAHRVLIVDDNTDAAESLAMLVNLWGFDARAASDGVEGLRLASEYRPRFVLLDLGLPALDGYEVARRIRGLPKSGTTMTLIAVTGYGQATDRDRAAEAGFDHHLVKPIDPEALRRLLMGGVPV
jgi:PAS domain S-box-containing protein